jgi:hypothetical protein
MSGALQVLIALAGIAALVCGLTAAFFVVAWLVGICLRFFPLVGRRHRAGPLVGRQSIETESSKLGTWQQPNRR